MGKWCQSIRRMSLEKCHQSNKIQAHLCYNSRHPNSLLHRYRHQRQRMGRWKLIPHSKRQFHLLSLTHHRLLQDQFILRRCQSAVVPDPVFGQDTMATNMLRVNYMKKMRPFYGNKPPRDETRRAWEEYLSEFVQNAETCRLPQDQCQNIAELMLAPEVRDQWMQAKASMNCNSWEGFNNYMSTHYAALDKSVEAERKFSNNVLTHETERAWADVQPYSGSSCDRHGSTWKASSVRHWIVGRLSQEYSTDTEYPQLCIQSQLPAPEGVGQARCAAEDP